MGLAGRRVLITGGARGIGLAVAVEALRQGAMVALLDLPGADWDAARRACRDAAPPPGRELLILPADVTDAEAVAVALSRVREEWGGLEGLVTSAGVLLGAYRQVADASVEEFRRVLDVNVVGTFLACKHASPLLTDSQAVVICIASGAGVAGPSSSLAYGASKAGVHGFYRTLEREMAGRGIRVHVVCPGSIDTEMKRENLRQAAAAAGRDAAQVLREAGLGQAEGVARVVAFALSPEADHLRGTLFTR